MVDLHVRDEVRDARRSSSRCGRPIDEDEPTEQVRLVSFDPDGETRVLEAIVFANSTISHDEARLRVASLTREQRDALMSTYVGTS